MALTNHIVSDSPTNNFAALNPLDAGTNLSFTNGNLRISSSSNPNNNTKGTIGVNAGKWYFEYVIVSGNNSSLVGIGGQSASLSSNFSGDLYAYDSPGAKNVNGSSSSYGTSFVVGDIIGVFFDLDLLKIEFFKSNVSQGVITGITSGITWSPFVHVNSATGHINFGQDPTFGGASNLPTGAGDYDTDAAGNSTGGRFAFQPPTGALALCTANLPDFTPDVDDDTPQDYFKAVKYTGNVLANDTTGSQNIDLGILADLIWIKDRNSGTNYNHGLFDSVRGFDKWVGSNTKSGEDATANAYLSYVSGTTYSIGWSPSINSNTHNKIAWCWKAGGPPDLITPKPFAKNGVQYETLSAANITAGTITPTAMSVNTDAGFSIVKYNGTGTSDDVNYSIPHGLSNAPDVVIVKNLDLGTQGTGLSWPVLFTNIGGMPGLDGNLDKDNISGGGEADRELNSNWGGSYPNTNTFFVRRPSISSETNKYRTMGAYNYIAYCWHSVEGYSKFGSYTGNGDPDGPFLYCGFRPAFVMIKRTDTTSDWYIYDSSRSPYNAGNATLAADLAVGESGFTSTNYFDFLSNGMKIRQDNAGGYNNADGGDYIFMAFAEQPFNYANAR